MEGVTDSPLMVAVLDDEVPMRKALSRLLTSHGYRIEEYASGSALLAAVGLHPIDCILLDLHMPELNGFDLMAVLQSRDNRIPVVAITGKDEPGLAARVRALGAHTVLLKPVDQESLLAAIDQAIQSSRKQNRTVNTIQGEHA